jgi:general L-amino acid transport system substrate-binding protein
VSAAIFGEDDKVEFVPVSAFDRFSNLKDDDFDMLSRATTHTMQREVLESGTGAGFSFSIPYLYNGLQFGGTYPFVECADNLTVAEDICQGTKICVLDGTTHVQEITAKIPNAQIVLVVGNEFLYTNFIQGRCNVIAGEQFDIAESIVRGRGYDGAYASGVKVHSKEPLCMVTRDDDPQWSDFVNWVMEALLTAEDDGITSRAATFLRPTTVFGDTFANMFSNAIQIVGNYGEIYGRNLEALLPRPPPDMINKGDSGLIYAFPFGDVRAVGDGPVMGGTLEKIRQRGYLRCGISRRVIFAQFNVSRQSWNGEYIITS